MKPKPIELLGIVVGFGSIPIGALKRNTTMAVYHDGAEKFQFDLMIDTPAIGRRYKITIDEEDSP